MEDRAQLEQERPRTSSVPSCESMEVRLDTTTVSSATVSTTTNDATATAATATAAAVGWEERERVNEFLPHSPQQPPSPLQASPPLPTLLGLGHLPTYKNQAETMIHSPDIPMAIATNLFVDGDSDVTNDTSVMIVHVPHHLSDVDICCSEANIIIPPQNHSIHRNIDIATLNAEESFTSSMMNRRLEDQYRHMVVASYEAQASSRTEEPRIAPDFIVASTTMNHQDTNENNQDFCDIYNRTLGIEGTVSNVTGYIRSRYRRRRICYMVMLGLATIGIAITITASRRNNNTATPQMQQQQHHHPDDEEQSMMKMPSSNQNVIGANIPVVKLPIYSTEELYHAVDEYIQLQMDYTMNEIIPMDDTPTVTPEALLTFRYGYPMNHWDVSRITNFTSIFDGQRNIRLQYYFNENLSLWNVTSATTMFRMFAKLNVYVGYGLEHWNVPNVMNMRSMFHDAYIFQGNISHWDVSQVQNFDRMFTDAHLFNTNIALWNTSSAESMSAMFKMAQSFNQNISQWNVHRVKYFSEMFLKTRNFNSDISGWNTSSATDMRQMFANTYMFNQDVSKWNVGRVVQFSQMFMGATHFNHSLCHWGEQILQHSEESDDIDRNVSGMFNVTSCLLTSDPMFMTTANSDTGFGPFCHLCIA